VLLLDEPFSNLDAKLRERARTWLRHLQSELALTTVFVTHDQDEALSMSDRILVMDGGRILQAGTPEEVYERPTSRFVAEFLGQCNIVVGRRSEPSEPSAAAVRVGDGTMELLLAEEPATADGMVECAIRPESIVISESMEVSQPNWFMADVLAVSFLGDHYLYELRIGDLELIGKSSHRILGARVAVYVSPEACRPLNRLETGNATTNLPEVATT
jgi:iron(III) transport system ATP-binding protein